MYHLFALFIFWTSWMMHVQCGATNENYYSQNNFLWHFSVLPHCSWNHVLGMCSHVSRFEFPLLAYSFFIFPEYSISFCTFLHDARILYVLPHCSFFALFSRSVPKVDPWQVAPNTATDLDWHCISPVMWTNGNHYRTKSNSWAPRRRRIVVLICDVGGNLSGIYFWNGPAKKSKKATVR
jgi:hypothetical protein